MMILRGRAVLGDLDMAIAGFVLSDDKSAWHLNTFLRVTEHGSSWAELFVHYVKCYVCDLRDAVSNF